MSYESIKAELRRSYDASAEERDTMDDLPWKQPERERFLVELRAHKATSLLEIGAGHGVSGRFYADNGLAVTCVDMSPELVERCRAKGLDAQVMDFAELDFPEASFDAVFGMNCLLHVPRANLKAVLKSVRRVLRPGGLFYWGQYGGDSHEGVFEEDHHEPKRFFSLLTDEDIQTEAARVFDVLDFHTLEFADNRGYQALILMPPH
ncbi:class I SAM-dependent DNA methyltransferase [Stackebrandtia nassauensis]|uniref:class I SAM-dependent DNA methyltransferase n=1 Tax=Stackebrandtia nassauensis TaxID=283811 RepID=UPI001B7F9AEE|nr:class I SAM-dependent methyltransferase [Stackebrandtia nassauensis]